MPKPKIPNQKNAYKKLSARLNGYTRKVLSIYGVLAKESAKLAASVDYDGESEFSFDDFPKTRKKVDDLLKYYSDNMQTLVYDGISKEWQNSNLLQDLLVRKVVMSYTRKIGETRQKTFYEHNNAALQAFKKRQVKGLNLSQRIWNQREDVRQNLEKAIATGIEKGMSAVKLSKKVSKYLNDYPTLAKDYKKKYGKAIDITSCEYRSVRLARNEINMAYRSAEQERWAKMDYIKGKEIKTTNSPTHKYDMCDELAGVYPRDFWWEGWHVNCMCYAIPIIMSEEEYWSFGPKRRVSEVPEQFNNYLNKNVSKITSSKSVPAFITNNERYITSENVLIKEREELYRSLKKDKNYKDVALNSKGGLKATHINHGNKNNGEVCLDGLTGYDLERELQRLAFNNGHSVILCKEGEQIPNSNSQYTALDMIFNGVRMDIKSICGYSGFYQNQINSKNNQLFKWNKQQNDTLDTLCLYFHDKRMFYDENMDESYKRFMAMAKKNKHSIVVKNIICAVKDDDKLILKRYSY